MTSEKRLAANRRNAQRSTGPRSAEGKARSRLNAVKHGLSASLPAVVATPSSAALAQLLAAEGRDPAATACAEGLANAEAILERCRQARADLAAALPAEDPDGAGTAEAIAELARRMAALDRYERKARRAAERWRAELERLSRR